MEVLEKYKNIQDHDYDPIWSKINSTYDIMPSDYLDFAYIDLKGNDLRSSINALSNAKKAMHLQTEILANEFGYQKIKKKNNFPSMLEFLEHCGVITASVLQEINSVRNKVEHDYIVPEKSQISIFVDVVKLYLGATDNLLRRFPSNIVFPDTDDECDPIVKGVFNVALLQGKGCVRLKYGLAEKVFERTVEVCEPEYFSWVKFLVNVSK
ncbi:hypothetical protein I2709_003871 [Vibrio mimicus]